MSLVEFTGGMEEYMDSISRRNRDVVLVRRIVDISEAEELMKKGQIPVGISKGLFEKNNSRSDDFNYFLSKLVRQRGLPSIWTISPEIFKKNGEDMAMMRVRAVMDGNIIFPVIETVMAIKDSHLPGNTHFLYGDGYSESLEGIIDSTMKEHKRGNVSKNAKPNIKSKNHSVGYKW